jgi:hypothetical protein
LVFLERKRKAELKHMGTKDVPILFWTKVPQQRADEEDTEAYLYVPISIAPWGEANNISGKDLCSVKIQTFQGGSPELYCRWRMDMQELFTVRDCDDILDLEHVEQQLKLNKTTPSGPAMDTVTTALKLENEVNQGRWDHQEDACIVPDCGNGLNWTHPHSPGHSMIANAWRPWNMPHLMTRRQN